MKWIAAHRSERTDLLNTGDRFLPHGGVNELYRHCGIDAEGHCGIYHEKSEWEGERRWLRRDWTYCCLKRAFAPHGSAQRLRLWRESSTLQARRRAKQAIWLTKNAELEVRGNENAFVSRGGKKIEKALNYFNIDPTDLVVMDVGASTGGFTDCLLRRGARKGVFH